jgi:glutamate/tyrosine decarboxylase-like PLP-dependent enzyme
MVGSAPSYAHGVIDPITELGRIALASKILLHVDGCIGGFVLPFFRKLGEDIPPFDFAVPGVTSMSVDLHKYAFCPKNASILIHRDGPDMRKYQAFTCVEWPGYPLFNMTMSSSKSGGPVAAAWATLHCIGTSGYLSKMADMLEGRKRLVQGLKDIPELYLMGNPQASLICFAAKTVNVFRVNDLMKKRGWNMSPQLTWQGSPSNIHLTLNPYTLQNAATLVSDLRECVELAKGYDASETRAKMGAKVAEWEANGQKLSDPLMKGIMELIGLSTTQLPEEGARVHECFDVAPDEMRKQMIATFMNYFLFIHDEEQARIEGAEFIAKKIAGLKQAAKKWAMIGSTAALVGAFAWKALRK